MLIDLKIALIANGIRQTRMAVELGWDPAKLSRIINETLTPTPQERKAIADYLNLPESTLFSRRGQRPITLDGIRAQGV